MPDVQQPASRTGPGTAVQVCPSCGTTAQEGYAHLCTLPGVRLPSLSVCWRCFAVVTSPFLHDEWHASNDGGSDATS